MGYERINHRLSSGLVIMMKLCSDRCWISCISTSVNDLPEMDPLIVGCSDKLWL